MTRKSRGPYQSTAACTASETSVFPRDESTREGSFADTATRAARFPPAELPQTAKRRGSRLYFTAEARRNFTAALASFTAAGNGASPLSL